MITTRDYEVARHTFSVTAENEDLRLMDNYAPFALDPLSPAGASLAIGDPTAFRKKAFALRIESADFSESHEDCPVPPPYTEELRQEDEGQTIICGKATDGLPLFVFQWHGVTAGWLVCSADYREGRLVADGMYKTGGLYKKAAIDNALMIMYALATANEKTALFHAAVVSHGGRGYMFLGPSGTGKSTHARLWQQHIAGVEPINDDNPVVRINEDGIAVVYGSPWSGKTPCYRKVSFPLGGIVVLSQAPYNKIYPLKGVRAYAALRSSISGTRWHKGIADGLHETETELTKIVPIWHMDCLPDKEAAQICALAITSSIK